MRLYTANLGADMWDRTLIVLTYARMTAVPGGGSYGELVESDKKEVKKGELKKREALPFFFSLTHTHTRTYSSFRRLRRRAR